MREYKKALKVLQDIAALFKHGEYSAITRFTGRLTETTEADDFKDMETVDLVTGEAESDELSTADRSDESASASVQTTQLGMSSEQVETNIDQLAPMRPKWAACTEGASGRPKQKPKAAKQAESDNYMVEEDVEMHENQLNLLTVYEILQGNPTFISSHETLPAIPVSKQTKTADCARDFKISASKPLMRPEEVVRMFSKDLIKKCMAKVTAYQRKRPGVCDLDIAVEIVGLGVFANSPVTLMKKWHQAHEVLLQVQKTLA
ncbi:hypothetical protein GQ600_10176 [Phytophthora cactorum]|nr:hypothetical protein GQ600_10176 [Phytophthora cactorum]